MNLMKNVNGVDVPLCDEEVSEYNARIAEWEASKTHRKALTQIHALESQITERRKREAILGIDNGWLANIDAQISSWREQL